MSETINTEDFQNSAPKTSGGGCGKVLLWLLFIAFILSCLCCAGLCGTGYYIESALNKGLIDDPVVAQDKAVENYGEFNLPDNVKPRAYFEMRVFGKYLGFACIYTLNEDNAASTELDENSKEKATDIFEIYDGSQGVFTFYTVSPEIAKGHDDAIAEGVAESFRDPKRKDWSVKRSETVSITINGQPRDFTFNWMEDIEKNPFLMVTGFFKTTKETPCSVHIYLPGKPEKESVIQVLENIQK